jgi:predicted phosphodiesterase
MPGKLKTYEGQTILPNAFQKWLLSNWEADVQEFHRYRGRRKFWIVCVGDMVEGIHHGGKQTISSNPADHSIAALALLQPLADKSDAVFMVKGTECHVRDDEEYLGKSLGATPCPDDGHYAWDTVCLEVGKHLIQCRHHMPTTSRVAQEGGALSANLGNTQLSYARHKQRVPDIIVSGHRHRCGFYYDDEGMHIACGAWQGLTRHGHKVVPGALPKLGLPVLDWVRGADNLPFGFVIKQPMPSKIEKSIVWQS